MRVRSGYRPAADGGKRRVRGDERLFAFEFQKRLESQPFYKSFKICVGKSLLYKIEMDATLNVYPNELKIPKRGQYAFETDLLVENINPPIPLVIIELKIGNFSTHEVITYSAKAARHKEVYPYLRYGFVVRGDKPLTRKFLTHNQGIDFALSVSNVEDTELFKVVRRQTRYAQALAQFMRDKDKSFKRYEKRFDVQT